MKSFLALVFIALSVSLAFGQNESAPLLEKEFEYKDWTYKDVRSGADVNLRKFTNGKKLVMVAYFAGWCPNWKHDAPFVRKMYDKYRTQGLDVIGVGVYDDIERIKASLDANNLGITAVSETASRNDKQNSLHYQYRRAAGDTRNWGSPWYIFLEPGKLSKGDMLTKKAHVVNGELIEAEIEKFIREKLGLADEVQKVAAVKDAVEVCDPAKSPVLTAAKP